MRLEQAPTRSRAAGLLAGCVLAAASAGCSGGQGQDLGRFEVRANLIDRCAEGGPLAAPEQQARYIFLRRVGAGWISWEGRLETLQGVLRDDGVFQVDQLIQSVLQETPRCVVWRTMRVEAQLAGDLQRGYEGFDGSLEYLYEPTVDSQCEDLLEGPTPIAAELPCTVRYELHGDRI